MVINAKLTAILKYSQKPLLDDWLTHQYFFIK